MIEPDHTRATELFLAARKLPQPQRPRFLDEACKSDAALRAEVESLLQFDQPTPPFMRADGIGSSALRSAVARAADDSLKAARASERLAAVRPKRIGEYEILDTLGEGGMGIVYLAEQTNPRRRVALKVIRSSWVSDQAIRRFEHEAEALARLAHPAIAQMYEAKLSGKNGMPPHIVMEYVSGEVLSVYARAAQNTVRERLQLFARICDAVEHAHQRGVIHRDLKPGNILVTPGGEPKVLDFGIARLCDDADRLRTLHTHTGELVGTLPYMSPEQVGGKSTDLDTRTDVYALGLILYELMAGQPALDLEERSLPHAAQIIREQDPPLLGSLDRRLRGDVETIVAKAIEKDRTRRYQFVGEMAADIRRHLTDRPILARPASRIYQFRKFARRNRAIVLGACLALLAMLFGTALASWQAVRAGQAARRAEATNAFLRSIFAAIDPYRVGPEVKVADIVQFAEANLNASAQGQPLLEADLRNELGAICLNLGLLSEAETQFDAAIRIRSERFGATHPQTLIAKSSLGLARLKQGRYADAEAILRETLDAQKNVLGREDTQTLLTMNSLAEAVSAQQRSEEAVALCEVALAAQSRLLGAAHHDTLATKTNLASAYRALGRMEEAQGEYREAIARLEETVGPDHPSTLFAKANLARLCKDEKRYAAAEALQREVCDGMRASLGQDHPDTLIAIANLAQMLWRGGKYGEAENTYRQVIPSITAKFGEDHPHAFTVSTQHALVLEKLGRLDEAHAILTEVISQYQASIGADHPKTKQVREHLDRVTRNQKERDGTDRSADN